MMKTIELVAMLLSKFRVPLVVDTTSGKCST